MTKLGIIAEGKKEIILQAIETLSEIDGLRIIYVKQSEFLNLYIIGESDYNKLKGDAF